ncbi:MAG: inosine/xanthosine triphosphatase [Euryarchaeota archaeon]|nr:inosine/xanthosine triphosphatase [Euryarchaeota archaeon]
MRIAVGSLNPVKVEAVLSVAEQLFGSAQVEGVEVRSGVGEQPVGMMETVLGAVRRARAALLQRDADFGVGIEAGLIEVPFTLTGYLDVQVCAVADRRCITLGMGSGFEHPPEVVRAVLAGEEVGEVMERLTGVRDIGRKQGAIGFLSNSLLDRTELTKQAVFMAFLPRLRRELYRI